MSKLPEIKTVKDTKEEVKDKSEDIEPINKLQHMREQMNGCKIGILFGCFDLLHAGHAMMLQEAKAHCDILVVGFHINQTNDSIDQIVDQNPCVLTPGERKIVLLSMRWIDYIIDYNTEDDVLLILDNLRPDIRILGDDYEGKPFIGDDRGIKIHYTSRAHGYSTTTVRRLVYEAEKTRLESESSAPVSI